MLFLRKFPELLAGVVRFLALLLLFFQPNSFGEEMDVEDVHCTCFKTCFLVCQNLVSRIFILLAFSLGSLTWGLPVVSASAGLRCPGLLVFDHPHCENVPPDTVGQHLSWFILSFCIL